MKNHFTKTTVVALLAAVGIVDSASAQYAPQIEFTHGPADCQSALPVYDGNIRKRPLALVNEGSQSAFVTCDIADNTQSTDRVTMYFHNSTNWHAEVKCTLVTGYANFTAPKQFVKSVTVANTGYDYLAWDWLNDNQNVKFRSPAISCLLPPGVSIQGVQRHFLQFYGN